MTRSSTCTPYGIAKGGRRAGSGGIAVVGAQARHAARKRAHQAHRRLEAREVFGKLVLVVDGGDWR